MQALADHLDPQAGQVGAEDSRELFYQATTALTSIARDLNNGNTTVAGGFSYSRNQPQLHPSESVESQHSFDGFASVTQSRIVMLPSFVQSR